MFDDGDPLTPTCDVTVEFPTGTTAVDAAVDCPQAPTGLTVPSLADVLVELVP